MMQFIAFKPDPKHAADAVTTMQVCITDTLGGGLAINIDEGACQENLFSTLRDSKLGVVNGE